jgi:arabinogalactan endo-1,4-beta-galactosidase
MSFYPLWHGKSLIENEPKSGNEVRPNTNARYPKRPILLRWIGTIGPTTCSGSPIKGQPSTNASVWENQALYDFYNRAVPALTECGLVEAKKAPIHPESNFPSKTFVLGLEPI